MEKFAKLKREEFAIALSKVLMTQGDFAVSIGSSSSWLSRLGSDKECYKCGVKFIRRVLDGFKGKYNVDDLFVWV